MESEKNRFTVISKGKETEAIDLELDPFIQHGHVIEVTGKTADGARVMVNGSEVPMISPTGSFITSRRRCRPGRAVITVTAQNCAGRSEHAAEEDRDPVVRQASVRLLADPGQELSV